MLTTVGVGVFWRCTEKERKNWENIKLNPFENFNSGSKATIELFNEKTQYKNSLFWRCFGKIIFTITFGDRSFDTAIWRWYPCVMHRMWWRWIAPMQRRIIVNTMMFHFRDLFCCRCYFHVQPFYFIYLQFVTLISKTMFYKISKIKMTKFRKIFRLISRKFVINVKLFVCLLFSFHTFVIEEKIRWFRINVMEIGEN